MTEPTVGETLLACMHEPSPAGDIELERLLDRVDLDALVDAAARHGVQGWVHSAARRAHNADLAARVEPEVLRATMIRLQARADLALVDEALDAASVAWLVFKGPVLDEAIHRPPHQRAYGDLDLLVPRRRLRVAIEALEATGATVLDRNWARMQGSLPAAVHLELANGSVADLHWHLLENREERRRFTIDPDGILDRRCTVEVFGRQTPTMDSVDTVVFVALHAASHGASRLLWLKDVEQCVVRHAPPWHLLVERCQDWGVGLSVATVLARVRDVLDLAVPSAVLRQLGYRPPWSTMAGAFDRLAPTHRSHGNRSFPRIIAAAAGRDQKESVSPLVKRIGRAISRPLNMPPPAPSRDPSNPCSPLHAAGGDDARREYLDLVAREH